MVVPIDLVSMFLHNILSSSFSLFGEVHQSFLQQTKLTTLCCHPHNSQVGRCSWVCKLSHLFLKILWMVIMKTHVHFFIWSDMPPKRKVAVSPCISKCNIAFKCSFWPVIASVSLSSHLAHVSTIPILLQIQTLSLNLNSTFSQGLLLFFLGWYTHFAPKHIHLWETQLFSFLNSMSGYFSAI